MATVRLLCTKRTLLLVPKAAVSRRAQRQKELVRVFYTEVAALEDVLEEAVYALGTDARTILVQIRKCALRAYGGRLTSPPSPPCTCTVACIFCFASDSNVHFMPCVIDGIACGFVAKPCAVLSACMLADIQGAIAG